MRGVTSISLHLPMFSAMEVGSFHVSCRTMKLSPDTESALKEKLAIWLSAPDPSITHNRLLVEHHKGTGNWFLKSETFKVWSETSASCLWIHGIRESVRSAFSGLTRGVLMI
jgi:hypothetical protein